MTNNVTQSNERRKKLLVSIAETTADYREGEIDPPTPSHVDRWVNQFEEKVQLPILEEMDHVLRQTYLSKKLCAIFFASLIDNERLTGGDPRGFWGESHYLNIQKKGRSQDEMRKSFGVEMARKLEINIDQCGKTGGAYIYLDDAIFTGYSAQRDISAWIEENAPDNITVYIIVIAAYRYGEYWCKKTLEELIKETGKKMEIHILSSLQLENRVFYSSMSEVLWPSTFPDSAALQEYLAYLRLEFEEKRDLFEFKSRQASDKLHNRIFSSEARRQLLEREFLLAGVRIRNFSYNPESDLRPLGFNRGGIGFGSTIVTYRNCPNNAPLALWWGDPSQQRVDHPLRKWYPLFQRKPNKKSFSQ